MSRFQLKFLIQFTKSIEIAQFFRRIIQFNFFHGNILNSMMSYHNFDEDLMADLPSCVFGGGQHMTPIENMHNVATPVGIPPSNSRNSCNMALMPRTSMPSSNIQHHQYNQMPHHHHHHHHGSGKLLLNKRETFNLWKSWPIAGFYGINQFIRNMNEQRIRKKFDTKITNWRFALLIDLKSNELLV